MHAQKKHPPGSELSRREFLKVILPAAAAAGTLLSGCNRPEEEFRVQEADYWKWVEEKSIDVTDLIGKGVGKDFTLESALRRVGKAGLWEQAKKEGWDDTKLRYFFDNFRTEFRNFNINVGNLRDDSLKAAAESLPGRQLKFQRVCLLFDPGIQASVSRVEPVPTLYVNLGRRGSMGVHRTLYSYLLYRETGRMVLEAGEIARGSSQLAFNPFVSYPAVGERESADRVFTPWGVEHSLQEARAAKIGLSIAKMMDGGAILGERERGFNQGFTYDGYYEHLRLQRLLADARKKSGKLTTDDLRTTAAFTALGYALSDNSTVTRYFPTSSQISLQLSFDSIDTHRRERRLSAGFNELFTELKQTAEQSDLRKPAARR